MSRRRTVAAILAAALSAAAALGLLVRGRSSDPVVAPDAGPAATADGDAGAPSAAAPGATPSDGALAAAPVSAGGRGEGEAVVRVVDEAGAPLAGVVLRGRPLPDPGPPAGRPRPPPPAGGPSALDGPREVTTGADGIARWRGPSGTVFLVAPLGTSRAWHAARVGGEPTVLRWHRTVVARIRVVTAEGTAVAGARVVFAAGRDRAPEEMEGRWVSYSSDDRPEDVLVSTTTGADGRAAIAVPVPPPPGRLRVTPADSDLVPVERDAFTPTDVEIVVARAKRVAGVVRRPDGTPFSDGEVAWRAADGRTGRARVEYDGTFEIPRLPPGPVELALRLEDVPGTEERVRTTVAAGTLDVELVAALGAGLVVRVAGWPREPGGEAFLSPEEGGGPPVRADVDLDGVARFAGLDPQRRYRLLVPARGVEALVTKSDAGPVHRGVDRTGLRAGDEPVEVALAPLRTVTFTVHLPGPVAVPARPGARVFAWGVKVRVEQPGAWAVGGAWRELARDASPALTLVAPVAGVVAGSFRYRVVVTGDLLLEGDEDSVVYGAAEGTVAADATAVDVALRAVDPRTEPGWTELLDRFAGGR